jgi:hypothetical protein
VDDGRSIGELFVRVLPAAEDDILRFQDVTFDLQDQELGIKLSAWIAQNWDDRLRAEVRREKVTPEQVANYFAGRRTAIQLSEVQGDRLLSLPGQRAEVHALSKQQDERALFLQTVVNLLALDHHVRLTVANEDQVRPLRQLFQAYAPGTQPFINFYAENGVQLASALNKVVGGFTVIVTGLEQAKRLDQSVTADAAFVLSDHLISQGVKAYDSGLADLATLALKAHQAGLLDKKTFQLIENATRTYAADSSALQDWAELLSTFQQIAEQLLQAA